MTATLVNEATPEPDPIADAIEALTTLARRRRTIGAGTPDEHPELVDFADLAAHVLTAVAANVGGIEELLAGRPGSWEADLVRQLVQGTAGTEPADLMRYRTEPLHVTLDVEADVFSDFGIEALYSADVAELDAREAAADATTAVRELYQRDQDAYREAFTAAVRQALTDRGLTIAVDVIEPARATDGPWSPDEELARELHEHARTVAVLPMTGQAPDFTQGTPGDALRAAGLTYIARVHNAD